MSELSIFVKAIEDKIKGLENALAQSMQNHNGLLGMLRASQEALAEATKIAESVAPTSGVAEVLEVADNVINDIESVASNVEEAPSAP